MPSHQFDFTARWDRAATLMRERGINALFLMKPANLGYLTGDGRLCALGLFTDAQDCIVTVPTCDYRDVQAHSVATDIRSFKNEEDMFHGFRDVIRELGLQQATIALEKTSSMQRYSMCSRATSCPRPILCRPRPSYLVCAC